MMRPVVFLLAAACVAAAWDGGSCRPGLCPGCRATGGTAIEAFPWMESVARWEAMFPTLRGLGMFLCSAGLDEDQARMIGDLVGECDRELAELESELLPPGGAEPFIEIFASDDFEALDVELAEGRVDEFEDEAVVIVSETVAAIREILTDSQIAAAAAGLRQPPIFHPRGRAGLSRDHGCHRSRGTERCPER